MIRESGTGTGAVLEALHDNYCGVGGLCQQVEELSLVVQVY